MPIFIFLCSSLYCRQPYRFYDIINMSNFSFAQLQETHICAKICCISGTFDMFYEKLSPAFCWVVNLFVANIASCCSFCKHNPTKEISLRWWTYWVYTLLSYFYRKPFVPLSTCFSLELLPMHRCKNQKPIWCSCWLLFRWTAFC